MTETLNTVYLAWLAAGKGWYPIGRLDCHRRAGKLCRYVFRYVHGALKAHVKAGFAPADCFPDFLREYVSESLFPLFQNRVMNPARSDFAQYLESMNLPPEYREPIHMLAVSGGRRQTDAFEVFPKIERASEGHFEQTFFLHGIRHFASSGAMQSLDRFAPGEPLRMVLESKNPGTGLPALRVETASGQPVGYTPNYLVPDFQYIQENCIHDASLFVERVTPANPLDSRVLVRIAGCWPANYDPMMPDDFQEIEVPQPA